MCSTDDELAELCFVFTFFARLVAYIAVLALLVFIVFAIMRYLDSSEDDSPAEQEPAATEATPVLAFKPPRSGSAYGTCEEEDIETGSCGSSSSEELYDGRICVICYDEERNCFFVPCGHCATCYDCAQRIFDGESKACPVCRRPIRKVRKWFTS